MKTYTSEAVFLLTTLVNMVRARSCDSHTGSCDSEAERAFINTVSLEIFEVMYGVKDQRASYIHDAVLLFIRPLAVHSCSGVCQGDLLQDWQGPLGLHCRGPSLHHLHFAQQS